MYSILRSQGEFKNGSWIAIVKDGTKAYDGIGREYTITKAALDADWQTWRGGDITVNHAVKEKGKMVDVKREGEFVFAKIKGLTEEALAVVNSPAFRGVSQESEPVEVNDKNEVLRLNGIAVTLVIFPETPACDQNMGCGVVQQSIYPYAITESVKADEAAPWDYKAPDYDQEQLERASAWVDTSKPKVDRTKADTKLPHHMPDGKVVWRGVAGAMAALLGGRGGVDIPAGDRPKVYNHLARHYREFKKEPPDFHSTADFSLYGSGQKNHIKSTEGAGGTKQNMVEITPDLMKQALEYMKVHPESMTEELKGIMKVCLGTDQEGGGTANATLKKEIAELNASIKAKDAEIAKSTGDNTKLQADVTALKSQLATKEKELVSKEKELADKAAELKSIQEKLPEMVNATLDARAKFDAAVTELKSIAPADKVTEFLATKPTTEAITGMTKMLGSISGKPPQAGVGSGAPISESMKQATEKLGSAIKKLDSKFKKEGGDK
uniref:Putative prohead protease n=1 Tax=viral metagenome TaxID=1070528 RepID=A0A6M3M4J7_9ZZZZ